MSDTDGQATAGNAAAAIDSWHRAGLLADDEPAPASGCRLCAEHEVHACLSCGTELGPIEVARFHDGSPQQCADCAAGHGRRRSR